MKRRKLIRSLGASISLFGTGCVGLSHNDEPTGDGGRPSEVLEFSGITARTADSGWHAKVTVEVPGTFTVKNVTLLGYSDTKQLVCENSLGTLDGGFHDVQVDCTAFPAIITATSGETCENMIYTMLRWTQYDGEGAVTFSSPSDRKGLWVEETRKCGVLPPETATPVE